MGVTAKRLSDQDANNTLRHAYIPEDGTISVNGFIAGKVNRKVDVAIQTTTIANDTEQFTFSESGTTLYIIKAIYTDGTRDTLLSVERTA